MSIYDADRPVMSDDIGSKMEWERIQKDIEAERNILSILARKPASADIQENKAENVGSGKEENLSGIDNKTETKGGIIDKNSEQQEESVEEKIDSFPAETQKNLLKDSNKRPDLSFFPGLRQKGQSPQTTQSALSPTQQAVSALKQQNQEIAEQQNAQEEEKDNLTPLFGGNESNETFIHKPKEKQTRFITPNSPNQASGDNVPKSLKVTTISEYLIMAGLVKSSFLASAVSTEMNDSYFKDVAVRNIYMGFMTYYKKYQKLPNELEFYSSIEENYINLGKSKEEVLGLAQSIFYMEPPDEDYLMSKTQEFIRQNNMLRTLSKTLDQFREGESVNNEQIVTDIKDSLSVKIEKQTIFEYEDNKALAEVRIEAVGTGDNFVIPSMFMTLNNALMYHGYQVGTLNLIVAPPSVGKTSLMINEGVRAAIQGHQVCHVFLGDMLNWDGYVRYLSCISGIPQREIASAPYDRLCEIASVQNKNKNRILGNIQSLSFPAGTKTVNEVIEILKAYQVNRNRHYDMVIIDYADNFARELKDNMYLEGGLVYDRLSAFARENRSVLLIATQPKISYWSTEIMPMEAAGESSKKQHVVDLQLCFNKPDGNKKSPVGTINIAKMRRGTSGELIRVKTDWACCRVTEIDEETYRQECTAVGLQPAIRN